MLYMTHDSFPKKDEAQTAHVTPSITFYPQPFHPPIGIKDKNNLLTRAHMTATRCEPTITKKKYRATHTKLRCPHPRGGTRHTIPTKTHYPPPPSVHVARRGGREGGMTLQHTPESPPAEYMQITTKNNTFKLLHIIRQTPCNQSSNPL